MLRINSKYRSPIHLIVHLPLISNPKYKSVQVNPPFVVLVINGNELDSAMPVNLLLLNAIPFVIFSLSEGRPIFLRFHVKPPFVVIMMEGKHIVVPNE